MQPQSATVLFFSPSGTTQKIAKSIAHALQLTQIEYIDLTKPSIRQCTHIVTNDLVIFGAPVYEEYIPQLVLDSLKNISFSAQPCLAFSVYGNIGYGLSLKQLHSELSARGLRIFSMGAFIAEHSFSSESAPLAKNRPNDTDLTEAAYLAKDFLELVQNMGQPLSYSDIPGKLPLMAKILPKDSAKLFTKTPKLDAACNNCRLCIHKCPNQAIDSNLVIDEDKCLRCFACVRNCPQHARHIEYKKGILVRGMLNSSNKRQKKNLLISAAKILD